MDNVLVICFLLFVIMLAQFTWNSVNYIEKEDKKSALCGNTEQTSEERSNIKHLYYKAMFEKCQAGGKK